MVYAMQFYEAAWVAISIDAHGLAAFIGKDIGSEVFQDLLAMAERGEEVDAPETIASVPVLRLQNIIAVDIVLFDCLGQAGPSDEADGGLFVAIDAELVEVDRRQEHSADIIDMVFAVQFGGEQQGGHLSK